MALVPRPLIRALALLLVYSSAALAQTYNPKSIRFEGSPGLDSVELLRLTGWHEGAPLSKSEIESGLQKLVDTGAFTNLSYTVTDTALTVKLISAEGSQALPVRFANLVWWPHDELIHLLEARVPLFHGELPLTGSLTDQVEAALVDILRDKGIPNAQLTSMLSSGHVGGGVDAIALSLTSPQVLVGETRFTGAPPELTTKLTTFSRKLSGQDFDQLAVTDTVHQTTAEMFEDAGYLDIANDPPVFSAPRKDLDHFTIDQDVSLRTGALYHIASIDLQPAPPLSASDLHSALTVKSGDPASASELRLAEGRLVQPYVARAYLGATATAAVQKDTSAHTVVYTFTFAPGEQFRFASIDTSHLTPAQQADFATIWRAKPGDLFDESLQSTLRAAMRQFHAMADVTRLPNHTVTIVLKPH